jgi:peptidoglycan/LPS O-acetylase OafA/YrhL
MPQAPHTHQELRHILELDGIRGLAILLVIGFHFHAYAREGLSKLAIVGPATELGWCGVDLFFALSGFLITGILLDSVDSERRAWTFYIRRALRILPLYYAAIAVYFLVAAPHGHHVPVAEQFWYWAHLSNWRTAYNPLQYPPLTIFWSLAIEEQFYIVWPFVVWAVAPRTLFRICIVAALACLVLRNLPASQAMGVLYPNTMYRLTPFRVDTLLLGAIGALLYRAPDLRAGAKRYAGPCSAAFLVLFLGIAAFAQSPSPHTEAMTRFGYSAIAIAFAAFVVFAAVHAGGAGRINTVLRSPLLRGFGKYSYCIYVIHLVTFGRVFHPIADALGGSIIAEMAAGAASVGIMYAAAAISWYGFEKHCIALGRRFTTGSPRPTPSANACAR